MGLATSYLSTVLHWRSKANRSNRTPGEADAGSPLPILNNLRPSIHDNTGPFRIYQAAVLLAALHALNQYQALLHVFYTLLTMAVSASSNQLSTRCIALSCIASSQQVRINNGILSGQPTVRYTMALMG